MRIDVPNELLNAEEFFSRLRAAGEGQKS
jgi:hypothetical protein